MDFQGCVQWCAQQEEFVAGFDRLFGVNLCRKGSPVELMIDDVCGRTERDWLAFIEFVYECVWTRLPAEAFERRG